MDVIYVSSLEGANRAEEDDVADVQLHLADSRPLEEDRVCDVPEKEKGLCLFNIVAKFLAFLYTTNNLLLILVYNH